MAMAASGSRTLSLSINRSPDEVYAYVSNPAHFPEWATTFCKTIRKSGEVWIIDTPDGEVRLRFTEPNEFRILDHYVYPATGVEIYVPMRVLANGTGSDILFTLFRLQGVSNEDYDKDLQLVRRDLLTLKSVLER